MRRQASFDCLSDDDLPLVATPRCRDKNAKASMDETPPEYSIKVKTFGKIKRRRLPDDDIAPCPVRLVPDPSEDTQVWKYMSDNEVADADVSVFQLLKIGKCKSVANEVVDKKADENVGDIGTCVCPGYLCDCVGPSEEWMRESFHDHLYVVPFDGIEGLDGIDDMHKKFDGNDGNDGMDKKIDGIDGTDKKIDGTDKDKKIDGIDGIDGTDMDKKIDGIDGGDDAPLPWTRLELASLLNWQQGAQMPEEAKDDGDIRDDGDDVGGSRDTTARADHVDIGDGDEGPGMRDEMAVEDCGVSGDSTTVLESPHSSDASEWTPVSPTFTSRLVLDEGVSTISTAIDESQEVKHCLGSVAISEALPGTPTYAKVCVRADAVIPETFQTFGALPLILLCYFLSEAEPSALPLPKLKNWTRLCFRDPFHKTRTWELFDFAFGVPADMEIKGDIRVVSAMRAQLLLRYQRRWSPCASLSLTFPIDWCVAGVYSVFTRVCVREAGEDFEVTITHRFSKVEKTLPTKYANLIENVFCLVIENNYSDTAAFLVDRCGTLGVNLINIFSTTCEVALALGMDEGEYNDKKKEDDDEHGNGAAQEDSEPTNTVDTPLLEPIVKQPKCGEDELESILRVPQSVLGSTSSTPIGVMDVLSMRLKKKT